MFEEMIPWEKEIYINMLIAEVEQENLKLKLEESKRRATGSKKRR